MTSQCILEKLYSSSIWIDGIVNYLHISDLSILEIAISDFEVRKLLQKTFLGNNELINSSSSILFKSFQWKTEILLNINSNLIREWIISHKITFDRLAIESHANISPYFLKYFSNIKSLHICGNISLSFPDIRIICQYLPRLETFEFDGTNETEFDDITIDLISSSLKNLKHLYLPELLKFGINCFVKFAKSHSNLISLSLSGGLFDEQLLILSTNCPKLSHLSFSGQFVTDSGIIHLADGLKYIKELHLWGIHRLSDDSIRLISETYKNTLEILEISTFTYSPLTNLSMKYIENLKNLRNLIVMLQLNVQDLSSICNGCKSLKSFVFKCDSLYPVFDFVMNNFSSIMSLVLIHECNDELLTNRQDLISSQTNFKLRKLHILSYSDVIISEYFIIQRIQCLKNLRDISFRLNISDKTLETISNVCSYLIRFKISNNSKISIAGVAKIVEKCNFLVEIEIVLCNIKRSGMYILQNINPNVKIDIK